jgi:hypothetical protein
MTPLIDSANFTDTASAVMRVQKLLIANAQENKLY